MHITLYFLLFFITNSVFAQSKFVLSNKEYLVLQDKARLYLNSNKDSCFHYSNKIEKSNNFIHKAFALSIRGFLFAQNGERKNANLSYNKAIFFLQKSPSSSFKTQTESYVYNYGGLIDWKNGELTKALDKYFIAKKCSEKVNDILQINKVNKNIAIINAEVGNYNKAIFITKECNKFIDEHKDFYPQDQYFLNKGNVNFNLGIYYEKKFNRNRDKTVMLDSALFYYNKTLLYSKEIISLRLKSLRSIGNILFFKNKLIEAEKSFITVSILAKDNNNFEEYYISNYNLGLINYDIKKFNSALIYLKKVDSIYNLTHLGNFEYINSNYYQAKIFEKKNDSENALKHSKIYLDNFDLNEIKLNRETLEINYKFSNQDLRKEMIDLQKKNQKKVLFNRSIIVVFFLFIIFLLIFFFINYNKRKVAEAKISAILAEHEINHNQINVSSFYDEEQLVTVDIDDKTTREISTISVDKETIIMNKLKSLEEEQYYLRSDFNQQDLAKKLKTNTTYLSYLVNKNYKQTFSAYYNELRINFVISEMINNTRFREYTTLAIAESAGFKNADSFSSSFKKKTGVTPYQFINEIKKRELL